MKICISRIDKLGDMILSLPAIKGIKIKNPDCKIDVLASKANAKVLKKLDYIDKVILINPGWISTLKEIFIIRKIKYNYFINLSPKLQSYILCFFSRSTKKAILIFQTRYKKKKFSKFFLKLFAKIFCDFIHVINRFDRLIKNEEIHQTQVIFELINLCGIKHTKDIDIDIDLPSKKISFSSKKLILIHLSERWINSYYSENNLLELIFLLKERKFSIILTTDKSTKNKFKKIYDNFKILSNNEFNKLDSISEEIVILDNLNFNSWIYICCSSSLIITPECGCTHIAAACKVPVNVIYDANNFPDAINKEYAPWKSKYNKFIFDEKNLNEKLLNYLR